MGAAALLAALCVAASPEASRSAAGKIDRIAREGLASGETLALSEDELNSFLRYDGAAGIPEGIDDVHISMRLGGGVVEAVIDLDQIGAAQADPPFFMKLLMRGRKKVKADVDYEAHGGRATAKVVTVSIDEFTLSGTMLEWFIGSFAPEALQPYISGEPVPLAGNLTEIRVEPGQAIFTAE